MPCRCVPAVDLTLYRTPASHEGVQAQQYFQRKGIAFKDIVATEDSEALQTMKELSGQTGQPVILVNKAVFTGFNPVHLDLVVPSLNW